MLCVCMLCKACMHTCTVRKFVYTTIFGICKFVCMYVCMNDGYNLLYILNLLSSFFPAPPPKRQMPTKSSLQKQLSKEKLLKNENYKKNFSSMKKLGIHTYMHTDMK